MLYNVYILIFSVCFIQQYHIISLQSHRPLNRFDGFDGFDAFDPELRMESPLYMRRASLNYAMAHIIWDDRWQLALGQSYNERRRIRDFYCSLTIQ